MAKTEKEHLINISDHLYDASRSIRILRSVAWSSSIKEEFFRQKCEVLPKVTYPTIDPTETLQKIDLARRQIPKDFRFENWANQIADILDNSSRLLSSMGTKDFYTYSRRLYGAPMDKIPDEQNTSLDLANHFEEMYVNIQKLDIIHVATSLNGHSQTDLKILSASHPGTTKTQEGLAVFAEYITGNLDLDRLRRLSDRIIAIQMGIDGADFIDLYRFYLTKTDRPSDAYENARRVCRGGVITGGAPFDAIPEVGSTQACQVPPTVDQGH